MAWKILNNYIAKEREKQQSKIYIPKTLNYPLCKKKEIIMIIILDKHIIPNIKPDLSNLAKSFVNACHDVYRNAVVDKYEMSLHSNVPFIELMHSTNEKGKIDVKIGTYQFESLVRGLELLNVIDHSCVNYKIRTLYDFTKCPRREEPISFCNFQLSQYTLESVEVSYKNLGNSQHTKKDYYFTKSHVIGEFSNELLSFTFKFQKKNGTDENFIFEIHSDDLIHRIIGYAYIDEYVRRNTDYKIAIYQSLHSKTWYDYGEARSIFNMIEMLRKIDSLIQNGVLIKNIDFETFGTKYVDGKIINKFAGYPQYDQFIASIACSKIHETEKTYILEFDKKLSSKMIPYYRFLCEQLLKNQIEQNSLGDYTMKISKELFKDKDFIIPFMLLNIMRNIDNDSNYIKYIHIKRKESNEEYSLLVNFKESIRYFPFELRVKDILQLKAKDEYNVIYSTGDRDDYWWSEEEIKLTFNCEIDTATTYVIKQAIPGIISRGNTFEYSNKKNGKCDRSSAGYHSDNSEEYKSNIVTRLCKMMYSLYKSGIWDN